MGSQNFKIKNGLSVNANEMITATGDLTLVTDTNKAYFGLSQDLSIFHNGTDSYVSNITGSLILENNVNNGLIYLSTYDSLGASQDGIIIGGATPNVQLNYNGATVLTTTVNGVEVGGVLNASTNLTVNDVSVLLTSDIGSTVQAHSTILDNTTASFTTTLETQLNALSSTATVLAGSWDASSGTFPGGGLAQNGYTYIVTGAGTVDGVAFNVGDRILSLANDTSTTIYTNNWLKLDYTDNVLSVNGLTGAVSLASTNLTDTAVILRTTDIGVNVQAHSSILDATTASFTTALESQLNTLSSNAVYQYIGETRNVAAPNATIPAHQLYVYGAETSIDLILSPKGVDGSLLTSIPDNTATGGNKRGSNAVDLQIYRAVATEVASGNYAFIGGGGENTASGANSVVAGGFLNVASGFTNATVGGGGNNTASGSGSTVAGGNSNTASGTETGILGGSSNAASGDYSSIVGGFSNTVSGQSSGILGGTHNNVNGAYAGIGCGTYNTANGAASWVVGERATDRGIYGRHVFASGRWAVDGDSQTSTFTVHLASIGSLTTNGAAAAATNLIVLPDNFVHVVRAMVVARDLVTGDVAAWELQCCVKRGTGVASVAIVGTQVKNVIAADTAAAAWDVTFTANTTYGSIDVTSVTGSTNAMHWSARIDTIEVS